MSCLGIGLGKCTVKNMSRYRQCIFITWCGYENVVVGKEVLSKFVYLISGTVGIRL